MNDVIYFDKSRNCRNGSKSGGAEIFIHKWVWLFISGVGVLCICHHARAETGFSKRGG